ncbi:MAG: monooxygenase [Rhodoferax sp.]|nr:monooxygenase [Actinomycetota bacterium]
MSEEPLVLLQLWGVAGRSVPGAVRRMATQRLQLRSQPGLTFAKLLGTGDGRTFTVRDADPRHWALLTVWDDESAAGSFADGGDVTRSWHSIATEALTVRMRPIAARGQWAGQRPFGDPTPRPTTGMIASITRARIAARRATSFWRAVPPVSADLHQVQGLRLAVGIGEAPIGLQGTFSLWDSPAALNDFAHHREPHVDAIRRTATEGWYAEELFARFEVLSVDGEFAGRPV